MSQTDEIKKEKPGVLIYKENLRALAEECTAEECYLVIQALYYSTYYAEESEEPMRQINYAVANGDRLFRWIYTSIIEANDRATISYYDDGCKKAINKMYDHWKKRTGKTERAVFEEEQIDAIEKVTKRYETAKADALSHSCNATDV